MTGDSDIRVVEGLEIRALRHIGHRLPAVPHASAVVNRLLKPFYLRKRRGTVTCDVLGRVMELDPAEAIDGNLIFCPHLYDSAEVAFLLDHLSEDYTFIDVGAHKGFYSLMASRRVSRGTIVAIEADPDTFCWLRRNIDLNSAPIAAVNCGVSDREETLRLNVQTSGNRSGSSFLGDSDVQVPVRCLPLLTIVQDAGLSRIDWMKLDIEGFEHKVLKHFLERADPALHPSYLLIEDHPDPTVSTGHLSDLLRRAGYREVLRTPLNAIFSRNR